jgi:hypothetical protein
MLARTDTLTTAGAMLAGREPDVPVSDAPAIPATRSMAGPDRDARPGARRRGRRR